MVDDTEQPGSSGAGQSVSEVMDRLESLRSEEMNVPRAPLHGVLFDQIQEVEQRLLALWRG